MTLIIVPIAEFPGRWNWGYDGVDLFRRRTSTETPMRSNGSWMPLMNRASASSSTWCTTTLARTAGTCRRSAISIWRIGIQQIGPSDQL